MSLQERAREAAEERREVKQRKDLKESQERARSRRERLAITVRLFADFLEVGEEEVEVVEVERLDDDHVVYCGDVTVKVDGLTIKAEAYNQERSKGKPARWVLQSKYLLKKCAHPGCEAVVERWTQTLADIGDGAVTTIYCKHHDGAPF